jgi:CheY-like chemotaxis protein
MQRLIVLDIYLPGLAGLTLLKAFRELFGIAQVIVMTDGVGDKVKADALKAGASAFLEKPVLPETSLRRSKQPSKTVAVNRFHPRL